MALVASALVMAHSETTLMERPRYHLPPLSLDPDPDSPRTVSIPPSDGAETHPNQGPAPSRTHAAAARTTRKKIFSFATTADMETYNGHVRTPADAIVLFEACRLGLLPRVQRRLSEKERQSISSGSVFVWDEREAGMRRWTDGKSWSASRVSGSFLTYREMEGKRGGGGAGFPPAAPPSRAGRTPEHTRGSESDVETGGDEGPDGYRYKPDGLMKQSFSITTSSGNHLHLISYYSRSHPASSRLSNPTNDPSLRHIRPAKGMYPESTVHEHQNIPAVTRSPMASAPFSTVPQMAGYARQQGPSQWPATPPHNGYAWGQPAPAHHQPPPQYAYGYQYSNPSPYNQAPPPTNGQAPFQYSPHAHHPTPQPLDHRSPAYDKRRDPPASQPTDPSTPGYDARRHPPPQSENRAPPPVHHPHETNHTNGYPPRQEYNAAQWDPSRNSPRPLAPPDNRGPPAQYHSQQSTPSSGPQHARFQYRSPHIGTAPPSAFPPQSQSANPTAAPSMSHIDPRLMAPAPPPPQQQSHSNEQPRSSIPAAPQSSAPPQANSTSQASTRPSIGALMNGSSASSYSNGHPNGHNAAPPAIINTDGNGRPGERAPNGSKKKDGPQDIPSGKVGFSEDMRALKVLDKGSFKT